MSSTESIDIGTPSPRQSPVPVSSSRMQTWCGERQQSAAFIDIGTPPPLPATGISAAETSASIPPDATGDHWRKDVLEEIDDPSELLARPLSRPSPPTLPSLRASDTDSSSQSLPSASMKTRTLPPGFTGASNDDDNGFVISGSGARVPTTFLDSSGAYSHASAEEVRRQQQRMWADGVNRTGSKGAEGSHTAILHTSSAPKVAQTAQRRALSSSDGTRALSAIDLTGDDEEVDAVPSAQRSSATSGKSEAKLEAYVVDDDDDDDDEPIIVSSRSADGGEVVLDEQRNNAIVCLGMITSVVLCMYGLPPQLTFAGGTNVSQTSAPGAIGAGRSLPESWGVRAKPADVKVGVVLPPLLAHPDLPPEEAKRLGPSLLPPFGSLAEKYVAALEPLMRNNKIRYIALVSDKLSSHGIQLEQPATYRPEDYPTSPEYSNPHNPPTGGYRNDARSSYSGLYRGSNMGTTLQTKEATEKQKREQVDAIYSSITSGEELEMVDPRPVIKTRLFQHQKQALSFLLEREQHRSWSDLKRRSPANEIDVSGTRRPAPVSSASVARVDDVIGHGGESESAKVRKRRRDEDSVSLWTVNWDSRGKARSYVNLITQREVKKPPTICRGAMLLDDMGLGKTITTIALIAHTLEEADAFGDSDLASYPPPDESDLGDDDRKARDDSIELVTADDFSSSILPTPRPAKKAKKANARSSPKPKRKVSRSKRDPEAVRQAHLERRSRATLIVCPLSVVANWEEQIREHWDKKRPPRIYVYHGNSRVTDTARLSNHDIVLTTYPTLGHEFSNQKTWLDESGSSGKGRGAEQEEEEDDDDDAIIMVNENGIPVEKKKKSKKRKKRIEDGKESANALQRIEWFRVVLDEAHYIKGALTWQSKAVCNLSAQRRLCLTGTPIQNSTDDLYALLKFLRLDPFTDRAVWNEFCGHKDNSPALRRSKMAAKDSADPIDPASLGHIQIIMKFLALRRTKDTKAADGESILRLPPKLSKTEMLDFEESEKARYHALHSRYKEEFEEMLRDDTLNHNYATILHEILNLRLACDHPSLVDASKDAKRRLAGLGSDPSHAISQDGLSRERAADLFAVFRDSGMAFCNECQADLTQLTPDSDGLGASGSVDALDDALHAAAVDQDRRIASIRKGKKASARSTDGFQTPVSADDAASTTPAVRPVVTRCQHLICSTCFKRHVGAAWPRPKLTDAHYCPACRSALKLAIDAIQLEPADFATDEEQDVEDDDNGANENGSVKGDGSGAGSDDESDFDWQDETGGKPDKDQRGSADSDVETADTDSTTEDEDKGTRSGDVRPPATGAGKGRAPPRREFRLSAATTPAASRKPRGDVSLHDRTDLSTKVRALLSDLIPFSRCNPRSALYDPTAPLLEHVDPKTADDEEVRQASDPVVVVQKPPSQLDGFEPVKSVVFSQWTKMLDRIGKSLRLTGIRFARLDGTMRRQDRNAALARFKSDPGTEVLLISLRAGGTGLNLVSACRAYLMDPYW
ncbi:related to RAD16 - nucleotide excision repair protein [Pseudozyma flocculosa]|uniref:Related to RAD16 - nucleotide excision repair protein n=1 Tax=Pseudozyma flocculosa TaxID=84751 RepID=A0A5C3F6D9_9BASI|nr:related to RAD16 - nucleotide excision repair protein [Pseudozyma flocculosa]